MSKKPDEFIESHILTGMIVSTDFLGRVHDIWRDEYITSPEVAVVASWVFEYFERYHRAPDSDIKTIYIDKLRTGAIDEERGELIETMLERASEDYGRGQHFNSEYLYDRTRDYFRQQHGRAHSEEVRELLDAGEIDEAARTASSFSDIEGPLESGLYLDSNRAKQAFTRAFRQRVQNVVHYPPPFGDMVNRHLVRDGFVAFLAPEKRGKTWWLMDVALRGLRQKSNVAFFQAGDMSEDQQLRRIAVYITRRPLESQYPQNGKILKPVKDCIFNQADQCDLDVRECDFGPFDDRKPQSIRSLSEGITMEQIREAMERDADYRPCHNCSAYRRNPWGSVWHEEVKAGPPLDAAGARRVVDDYFRKHRKGRFKLKTYASGTLSPLDIRTQLNAWERRDGFIPDIVAIDYADLLDTSSMAREFRHRQSECWSSLRGLAQERRCLVITATQADARSYDVNRRLGMGNFSEDKRKNAHVTAMFGLNQGGPNDRERRLGLMYVNEIVIREGDFTPGGGVYVLQSLSMGRPFLGSFR